MISLVTILVMGLSTYLTRIAGFLLLRNRTLSPKMETLLNSIPGCVLISVIAPAFFTLQHADIVALAITLIAAWRFGLLPVVIIGISSTFLSRLLL